MSLLTLPSHLIASCVDDMCVQCLYSVLVHLKFKQIKVFLFLEKNNNLVILTDDKLIKIY